MSVSVILPTLNAADEIAALLAALMDQTQPPEEILVVDSGSTDDTCEAAGRRVPIRFFLKVSKATQDVQQQNVLYAE